jgi:formate dehydrogenase (NADP+) beta subunit
MQVDFAREQRLNSLLYGVWDDKLYDFRGKPPLEGEPLPDLQGLDTFAPGNPVRAFLADRGFLVFDAGVSLAEAFWQYLHRAAEESCGQCTPCRVGSVTLDALLDGLRHGSGRPADLLRMRELADLLTVSSLCGLGQTCARALQAALLYFPDMFERDIGRAAALPQHGMVYVTAPCIEACPARLDVPRYIDYIRDGRPDHALAVILDKYPLAASCGRVCVRFCELACQRKGVDSAVGIKMLKRYAADQAYRPGKSLFSRDLVPPAAGRKRRVAVVGSGAAGITCAYQLLRRGIAVDVLEMQSKAGGMASVGIPSYRLPKYVLKAETEQAIMRMGGRMIYGQKLGPDYSVDELFAQGYDSVFLGYGASRGTLLGVADEDPSLEGYYSGIDFLKEVHDQVEDGVPFALSGEVVVVGAGNVAMDCVRSAVRLGAGRVHLVYRRTRTDMPADHEEIEAAEKEGVIFHFLSNPSRLLASQGRLTGVEVLEMRVSGSEGGRQRVKPVPGSEHTLPCDTLIVAIGQQVDRETLRPEDGVEIDRRGCVKVDPDTMQTSRNGVFAGGDCVLGPVTLIQAMAQGEIAARSIAQFLRHGVAVASPEQHMQRFLAHNRLVSAECLERPRLKKERFVLPEREVAARVKNFAEVEDVIAREEAYRESERCLRCYRIYSVVTEAPLAALSDCQETADQDLS